MDCNLNVAQSFLFCFFKLFPAPDKCCGERKRKEGKGNFLLVYKKFVNSADGVCRVIFEPPLKIVFITILSNQFGQFIFMFCFVFYGSFYSISKIVQSWEGQNLRDLKCHLKINFLPEILFFEEGHFHSIKEIHFGWNKKYYFTIRTLSALLIRFATHVSQDKIKTIPHCPWPISKVNFFSPKNCSLHLQSYNCLVLMGLQKYIIFFNRLPSFSPISYYACTLDIFPIVFLQKYCFMC
jgi:hypothetical protein